MKRRTFLQLAASATALAQETPRPILRMTRLYAAAETKFITVPDVLPLPDKILAVGGGSISASQPDGKMLWQFPLPPTPFPHIAGIRQEAVLLNSLNGRMISLNPADGTRTPIKGADSTGFLDRLHYAGDGYLIRAAPLQIELWNAAGDRVELLHRIQTEVAQGAQVDLISPKLAAVTSGDRSSLWTIDIPSGRSQQFEPDVTGKQHLPVVTGVDRERARLLWHFAPSKVVSIDTEGNIEPYAIFEPQPRKFAARLMRYGAELGVVYHDGSVAWHAV